MQGTTPAMSVSPCTRRRVLIVSRKTHSIIWKHVGDWARRDRISIRVRIPDVAGHGLTTRLVSVVSTAMFLAILQDSRLQRGGGAEIVIEPLRGYNVLVGLR